MRLVVQKRIAADVLKCSQNRISFDQTRLSDIKEAITKADIRSLAKEGVIRKLQKKGVSRARAKVIHTQRTKGRKRGQGRRKGSAKTRTNKKGSWINRIKLQRTFLKELKTKSLIDNKVYRELYNKAKGGFFRSRNHLKTYIGENNLFKTSKSKDNKKGEQ